jgi:protein SCO1
MNRNVLVIAALVLLGGLAAIGYQFSAGRPEFKGVAVEPVQPAPAFTLHSADGKVNLSDFRGKVVLLYFGYTYCPDVCPVTLSSIKRVLNELGEQADQVQLIFITVDPRRDSAARMTEYAHFFSPSFVGLSGTMEEITRVAGAYDIHYHYNDAESQTQYSVDHTASVIVVDKDGNKRLTWPFGMENQDMAADLKKLVEP